MHYGLWSMSKPSSSKATAVKSLFSPAFHTIIPVDLPLLHRSFAFSVVCNYTDINYASSIDTPPFQCSFPSIVYSAFANAQSNHDTMSIDTVLGSINLIDDCSSPHKNVDLQANFNVHLHNSKCVNFISHAGQPPSAERIRRGHPVQGRWCQQPDVWHFQPSS
eukprot:68275-Chlamydomonas_euryale.AAC.4